MKFNSFKDSFLDLCIEKKYEKNQNQLEIVNLLENFFKHKKNIINLFKSKEKLCFYLYGGVGFGKTMIFNHYYDFLDIPKTRLHFNEFMIKFHDFRHENKKNSIKSFVKDLKIYKLIYLDELQVTDIVDAMILGKLFENIFNEKIKILITSNIKIDDLYKDGLQREQFKPFISIIKKNAIQKELVIDHDYRRSGVKQLNRVFSPLNEKISFKINQIFRELTKFKKKTKVTLKIKGRNFFINDFYEGIVKFEFKTLCDDNLGAEDYIEIAKICNFLIIENIPSFDDFNVNQQQRFITLIDILYEKKIPLVISMENDIKKLSLANKLAGPFKRTSSRLYELTSST